jgi:hypothetical protein
MQAHHLSQHPSLLTKVHENSYTSHSSAEEGLMEIVIVVNLTAMRFALIFIALEVRKVSEQVSKVAQMEEQTQKLIVQTLSGTHQA